MLLPRQLPRAGEVLFLEAIPMNSPRSVEENANSAIGSSERLPRAILAVGLIVIWGGIAWLVFHLILGTA
jgi:hypothetical protein